MKSKEVILLDIFKDRILPLINASGKTDRFLEEAIRLPRGIIYKWKNGKNKNYKFYIVEIAAYFHVSTDYLLGNTDDPRPAGEKEKLAPQGERIADEDVKAAFFHGADPTLTEEEMENLWEDAKNYMMYKISQRSRKNENEQ